ncbi:MAG TPA: hypothetical protein VL961_02475 [Acidimicrobiales bacterium]|nr:hypothetical protein [Acidimicrobiales bacterium]
MAPKSRGLQVFRRSDAVDLVETPLMERPVMDPVPDREVLRDVGTQAGYLNKVVFWDAERGGMNLIRLWYAPHYALPRHSHDVDCLYYVVSGEAHLGNRVLGAGDGFFVPAGAPYAYRAGPHGVEVLEFRASGTFGIRVNESLERWTQLASNARTHREEWEAASAAAT